MERSYERWHFVVLPTVLVRVRRRLPATASGKKQVPATRSEAMNGITINPWILSSRWSVADRYILNSNRSLGLWSMMYLRRTELEYAKL